MSLYHDAKVRYRNDPTYHAVVQYLESILHEMRLTPGELRDAAMLAAIHFEQRRMPLPTRPVTDETKGTT